MRFGVNYTPSAGWFHSWLDFDADAVRRDLADIAGLGVDHIRVFPLWPLIQPHRGLIRPRALADVAAVVDVAAEFGLAVNIDALQGHLSSFDFLPSWVLSWHRRNLFSNPEVVGAQADYIEALTAAVADRANLLGVTLGNEVNQFSSAHHPDRHPATRDHVDAWLTELTAAARRAGAPLVTQACYDATWYDDLEPFRPEHAARHGDLTVVHSWVFNGAAQAFGGLGEGSVRHGEYLLRLAAAWHDDPGRGLWLQEVGAPTNVVAEPDVAAFTEQTLRHAADVPGLWGVTWWCSHDVSRTLLDFPELEYSLGLFTNDHEPKPAAHALSRMIQQASGSAAPASAATPAGIPSSAASAGPPVLVLDDTDADTYRSRCGPGQDFHRDWLKLAVAHGTGPAVVLQSRLDDPSRPVRSRTGDLQRDTELLASTGGNRHV